MKRKWKKSRNKEENNCIVYLWKRRDTEFEFKLVTLYQEGDEIVLQNFYDLAVLEAHSYANRESSLRNRWRIPPVLISCDSRLPA